MHIKYLIFCLMFCIYLFSVSKRESLLRHFYGFLLHQCVCYYECFSLTELQVAHSFSLVRHSSPQHLILQFYILMNFFKFTFFLTHNENRHMIIIKEFTIKACNSYIGPSFLKCILFHLILELFGLRTLILICIQKGRARQREIK